jgi:hypothetical protein
MDIKPIKNDADEKAALSTIDFFEERRKRADVGAARDLMSRVRGEGPNAGDEV